MTDLLSSIPPRPPNIRPIGPRSASNVLSTQTSLEGLQAGVQMGFSYPGLVATIGPNVCWPLPRNYAGYVYRVIAFLGTPDSSSDDITVGYWYNGTEMTTLVIPSGSTYAMAGITVGDWTITGTLSDYFQGSVDTYAGTTASNLTLMIQAY